MIISYYLYIALLFIYIYIFTFIHIYTNNFSHIIYSYQFFCRYNMFFVDVTKKTSRHGTGSASKGILGSFNEWSPKYTDIHPKKSEGWKIYRYSTLCLAFQTRWYQLPTLVPSGQISQTATARNVPWSLGPGELCRLPSIWKHQELHDPTKHPEQPNGWKALPWTQVLV